MMERKSCVAILLMTSIIMYPTYLHILAGSDNEDIAHKESGKVRICNSSYIKRWDPIWSLCGYLNSFVSFHVSIY